MLPFNWAVPQDNVDHGSYCSAGPAIHRSTQPTCRYGPVTPHMPFRRSQALAIRPPPGGRSQKAEMSPVATDAPGAKGEKDLKAAKLAEEPAADSSEAGSSAPVEGAALATPEMEASSARAPGDHPAPQAPAPDAAHSKEVAAQPTEGTAQPDDSLTFYASTSSSPLQKAPDHSGAAEAVLHGKGNRAKAVGEPDGKVELLQAVRKHTKEEVGLKVNLLGFTNPPDETQLMTCVSNELHQAAARAGMDKKGQQSSNPGARPEGGQGDARDGGPQWSPPGKRRSRRNAGGVLEGVQGMRGRQGPGTKHGGIPAGDVASVSDGGGWITVRHRGRKGRARGN
jgi:hypothetical protein